MIYVVLTVLVVLALVFIVVAFYSWLGKKKSQSKQNLTDEKSVGNAPKNITGVGDYFDAVNKTQGGVLGVQTSIIPDDPDDTDGAVI